jgi:hypothetical protein
MTAITDRHGTTIIKRIGITIRRIGITIRRIGMVDAIFGTAITPATSTSTEAMAGVVRGSAAKLLRQAAPIGGPDIMPASASIESPGSFGREEPRKDGRFSLQLRPSSST